MAIMNGIDLYVEVHGEGTPILGIHGTPSASVLWTDAAQQLAKHGRCIIYDRCGFYRSAPAELRTTLDLTGHVADAAALLTAEAGEPSVVIGRSTGGLIALELARRHPDKVAALVLLEPALLTLDSNANDWGKSLRRRVLSTAESDPGRVSEAVIREALGDQTWDEFPQELQDLFADLSPAVVAETRGVGLDLSEHPLELSEQELSELSQPVLVVAAHDSPEPLRTVAERLADALPEAEIMTVTGGHLINPAHASVLEFIDKLRLRPSQR